MIDLYGYEGKIIKLTFIEGIPSITGKCLTYTSAQNNEPEIASIEVRGDNGILYDISEDEVKSVEVISA